MRGRYLYKYLSFDQDMLVMDIIRDYKILFSAPSRFNDPFDCNPRYLDAKSPVTARPDLFECFNEKGISPAKKMVNRERAINRMSVGLRDGSLRDAILSDVGIVSLSRTPWSVLMWSHYADKHSGFMVEFQEPAVFTKEQNGVDDRWLVPFKVQYVKERPSVPYWENTEHDAVEKYFTYKSDEWEYEQEERVVKVSGGAGAFPYEPELLVSVVAGCNISSKNFAILSGAIKQSNKTRTKKIKLYRAEVDSAKYRLNIPGFKRPRPNLD